MAKKKEEKIDALEFLNEVIGEPLTIGSLLETIRETDDYTLAAFARRLGITRSHLCDIEKGRTGVSVERAAKWAKVLGYSESQFVALALQAVVDEAGLKYSVGVKAA